MTLILASQSAARATLLAAAGFTFIQQASGIPEPPAAPGTGWEAHLAALAKAKALAVAGCHANAWVLGADTALWFDGDLIGKAATPAAAGTMLERLVGRTHIIATAVCLIAPAVEAHDERAQRHGIARASVTLRAWSPARIRRYVSAVRPFDCAGAYALQGGGAAVVAAIHGDPSTVIGLPLTLVECFLRESGFTADS
ncbi:MAG: Maf family nucleotide pyrophosphatase [bacterium]